MKGLLHSKKFKSNLRKWLFMYVGVMVLLTTVVTYSKYITSLYVDDEARTSKFNLEINSTICPTITDETSPICNSTSCRPTSTIATCFKVDTSNLEVDSNLWLMFNQLTSTVEGKPNFEIEGIDLIDENSSTVNLKQVKEIYPVSGTDEIWQEDKSNTDSGRAWNVKLTRYLKSQDSGVWTIRIRTKQTITSEQDYSSNYNGNLVEVGYAMVQDTSKGGN